MSEITPEVVRKIARLAHLRFEEDEEALLGGQLDQILGYVRKLGEVDTAGVPETAHVLPLGNVWREDETRPCLSHDEALAAAPDAAEGAFAVPRIIE